jgi:hypothetical protein
MRHSGVVDSLGGGLEGATVAEIVATELRLAMARWEAAGLQRTALAAAMAQVLKELDAPRSH